MNKSHKITFSIMNVFHQEAPPNPSKNCKFLASLLKDAFAKCHSFRPKPPVSTHESEEAASDNPDEDEQVFISAVISRYMESKRKRKSIVGIDNFKPALYPNAKPKKDSCIEENDGDDFLSAGSQLSRCSSNTRLGSFVSVKTCLSRSSSSNKIDFQEFNERPVILEVFGCKGWPFGLCRKAILLPPLPKSPSDSWSWRKNGGHTSQMARNS